MHWFSLSQTWRSNGPFSVSHLCINVHKIYIDMNKLYFTCVENSLKRWKAALIIKNKALYHIMPHVSFIQLNSIKTLMTPPILSIMYFPTHKYLFPIHIFIISKKNTAWNNRNLQFVKYIYLITERNSLVQNKSK